MLRKLTGGIKVGTRRPLPPCELCGGDQYEQYETWSVYHNDFDEGWVPHRHLGSTYNHVTDYGLCLREMVVRIAKLESKPALSRSKINPYDLPVARKGPK